MKGIKGFFRDFNEEWTIKFWAWLALLGSIVSMTFGFVLLTMYYSPDSYTGVKLTQPSMSLTEGWILTSLGIALLCVSSFGIKTPKKKLSTDKIKAQERR
jgi:hypothetical protein